MNIITDVNNLTKTVGDATQTNDLDVNYARSGFFQ